MIKFYILGFALILVTTILITLKLTETIDWSWWFIFLPVLIPSVLIGLFALFIFLIGGVHVQ